MRVPSCVGASRACAQLGILVPAQEAACGGQAIRDLQSPSTVVGLKAGVHAF
jgi:hypothetical protein